MAEKKHAFVHLRADVIDNLAQSLLAAKTNAANVLSVAESLEPLVEDEETATKIERLRHHAEAAKNVAYELYREVARPAFRNNDGGK